MQFVWYDATSQCLFSYCSIVKEKSLYIGLVGIYESVGHKYGRLLGLIENFAELKGLSEDML